MLYENEFALLRETFKKSRVPIAVVAPDSTVAEAMDDVTRPFFASRISGETTIEEAVGGVEPQVLYRFRDHLTLSYIVFAMFVADEKKLVIIGPYTDAPLSSEKILEISERNGFTPHNQRVIDEFFMSVSVIPENSALFLLLEAFCERYWNGDYEIVDIHRNTQMFEDVLQLPADQKELDDTFLDMKNMERRYALENAIMEAVARGSEYKFNQIFSSFTESAFERRIADPIRNLKNYLIIMNTLLRKAAERGGVHPIYLDRVSSQFAYRIEQVSAAVQVQPLMADMFRTYCRWVRNNTTNAYSPVVKKAVIAIEADPSAELSLHVLARKLSVSNVYLSSVFKKETGKTITEYIREKRMAYATSLLKTTRLQIQTVALHCGMVDVQYFSKLFKQHTGKTPSQFRAEHQGGK